MDFHFLKTAVLRVKILAASVMDLLVFGAKI